MEPLAVASGSPRW